VTPPSPGSSSAERTGARPSPVLLVCSSLSRSPSPAWDAMVPCSGRPGLPIFICGQSAPLDDREPPTECERAGTRVRPANQGGSRCHRSGRRRIRRQAGRARRRSRSRRRRPRAGSSGGWSRPSIESRWGLNSISTRLTDEHDPSISSCGPAGWRRGKRAAAALATSMSRSPSGRCRRAARAVPSRPEGRQYSCPCVSGARGAQGSRGRPESCDHRKERRDGQPLSFSASSVCGVSTRFRLQITMIPRCEQGFGTPHGSKIATGRYAASSYS
jgi:hypothetical protein